jgi:hypothetical protein
VVTVDWSGYEPYVPPYWGPSAGLTRSQARESFDHLMAARFERIEQLRRLTATSGLRLGDSDTDIQALDDWFCANVEPNPDQSDRLRNLWYAVVNDIALHLGEVLIGRCPHLHWELFVGGKTNVNYHCPVVTGFTRVQNSKYHVEFDLTIGRYGVWVISQEQAVPDQFLKMVKSAESFA